MARLIPIVLAGLLLGGAAAPARDRAEVVLQNITVLDVATGRLLAQRDVIVRDARIGSIGPTGGALPEAKYIVDGTGKVAIPGLFDEGARLESVPRHLAGRAIADGITSASPADLDADEAERWRRDLDRGQFYGPRLVGVGLGRPEPVDTAPSESVHETLVRLVYREGLSPAAALRAVTLGLAERFGRASDLGSIDEGKIADIVVLTASPLANIQSSRAIDAVVFRGEMLTRAHLNLLAQGRLRPGDGFRAVERR